MSDGIHINSLLSIVSKAIIETQQAIEKETVHNFLSFFEEQNNMLKPLSRDIEISISDSGERKRGTITAPLVTLIPHKGMEIQKAEITIKSKLLSSGEDVFLALSDMERGNNGQENIGEGTEDNCEIKLVLQSIAPADGIQEIIGFLHKSI